MDACLEAREGINRLRAGEACVQRSSLGKAKSIIVLYLYGAPSQMDPFAPKPDAPPETRGEFKTIAPRLPGTRLCEHLPRIASRLDRVALIRSMTHPYPTHPVAYAL